MKKIFLTILFLITFTFNLFALDHYIFKTKHNDYLLGAVYQKKGCLWQVHFSDLGTIWINANDWIIYDKNGNEITCQKSP